MPALPFLLLAFAVGATLLQWQAELPQVATLLVVAAVTAGLAVGIRALARATDTAGSAVTAGAVVTAWAAVTAGAVGAAAPKRTAWRGVLLFAALLLAGGAVAALGFGYAAWRAQLRLADELPAAWEGVDVAVIGIVDELPQATPRGTRLVLAVERVETPDAQVPSRLSLSWFAEAQRDGIVVKPPDLAAGERWRLVLRLRRPHGNVNPSGYDVEAWLLERNLRATGYVRRDIRNERLDSFAGRPQDWVERARESTRARIRAALPDAEFAGVVVALAIGDQRAISDAQWRLFARTGISHLVSISGLHITVLAALAGAIAYALARRSVWLTTRIPARKLATAVGVVVAIAYVSLAGAQIPALRTMLMLVVAGVGLWLARPGTALVVWLWALAVVVAWDPWAGLTPGFWLSFGSVGLLLYAHAGRIGESAGPAWRVRVERGLRAAIRTQALVTVGLVPLTLALFQQVSLVSPLANAIAIPVVTFAVVPLALLGIVLPVDVTWQGAHAILAALMQPVSSLATWPGGLWEQHAPPAWAIAAALAGVAWIAAPRGIPGRALGAIWLLPLFVVLPARPPDGGMRLTVLDVGQGLAAVVTTRHHTLVYDTGPRYHEEADAGGRIVAPFLRAAGVGRLGGLVVSHEDSDHSGGAATLLATVPVDWLASSLPDDHDAILLHAADGGRTIRCEAGQRWAWDGVRFTILHPPAALYDDPRVRSNDRSCVVKVETDHGSLLLTGDIEARSERALLAADPVALAADIVVVPHHGARTSSTPAFVAATRAGHAVFTPGYRNRFGHPRPDVVARYAEQGAHLWRTDHDGALTFEFASGHELTPRRERLHDRRYWREAPRYDPAAGPE